MGGTDGDGAGVPMIETSGHSGTAARAAAGDQGALGDLYRAHNGRLRAYLHSRGLHGAHAEDVASEVWVRVVGTIRAFDPARARFWTWLRKVADNAIVDAARAHGRAHHKHVRAHLMSHGRADAISAHDPAADVTRAADAERLRVAVAALPPRDRQVIELTVYAGWAVAEVAAALGISANAVKQAKHRGLRALTPAARVVREHNSEAPTRVRGGASLH